MNEWTKIFVTQQLATATLVADMLEQQQIPTKLLNRKDSAYVFMGDVEVYVPNEFITVAKEVVKSIKLT